MNSRCCLFACGLLVAITPLAQTEQTEQAKIRFDRRGEVLFVNAADLARSLDFELKIVEPGELVTFCRSGDEGFCIPIRLTDDIYRGEGNGLMLAVAAVGPSLRVRVAEAGGKVTVAPLVRKPSTEIESSVPAYNADWGPGRGFRKGDRLPDIPLVDLDGNEVRFSQYLGKRYILYCWASW